MLILPFVSFAFAALFAFRMTSRDPEHRATGALLAILLVVQLALMALDAAVLAPLRAHIGVSVPWKGWAWAAALFANALQLAWPAAILGTAIIVYRGRKPWAAVVAWTAAVIAYAWLHPIAGDGSQMRFHALADILGTAAAAWMGAQWCRKERTEADGSLSAPKLLGVMILMNLLGLSYLPRVGVLQAWPQPEAVYVIVLAVLVLLQGYKLQDRIAAHAETLMALGKGNLRANIVADAAHQKAERAEEKATEARDIAENALPPRDGAPPSSRRSGNGATPSSHE